MKYIYAILLFILSNTGYTQSDSLPSKPYYINSLPVIKDPSRNRVQIMDGYTRWLSNLEVHITILEPGKAAHPAHKHNKTEELIIVKEGKLKVTIAGKTRILGPGGVAMSMPGDLHEAVNIGKERTSYYLLKYTTINADSAVVNKKQVASLMVDWDEVQVKTTDRGFRREHFIQSTVLFEKFDMHATTLKKGEISHAPHTHRQEEIIIVRKGNIEMQIGNEFYKAAPGDLIFLNSGIPHALKNLTDGECEYFAFQWQ